MLKRRRIPLEGTENTRDLGGYPIGRDKMTKYGVFLRSGLPRGLSENDESMLKLMGITTIIDLRSPAEVSRRPSFFEGHPGFLYHHLHLTGEGGILEGQDQIGLSYFNMTKGESAPKIFRHMASMEGGCLFHCTAGKDRTGTISAILLLLAGAKQSDIVADYCISYSYLAELIRGLKVDYPDLPAYLGRSDPDFMEDFLRRFLAEYGSAEAYLRGLSLSAGEIEALRDKLV